MNEGSMKNVCPSSKMISPAYLNDYSLVFNHSDNEDNAVWANIQPSLSNKVWGIVYKLDSKDIKSLDEQEVGYKRRKLPVHVNEYMSLPAHVYISYMNNPRPSEHPKQWYIDVIKNAGKNNGFPDEYISNLENNN